MMNRIDPDLFAACFMDWVRACWPDPLDMIAIGKTVRRSHDRTKGRCDVWPSRHRTAAGSFAPARGPMSTKSEEDPD